MKTPETREVYVTKYWETAGIQKKMVEECHTPGMVRDCNNSMMYYHAPNWHETYEQAKAHAEKLLVKRIASIEKKLKKLKSLKFE